MQFGQMPTEHDQAERCKMVIMPEAGVHYPVSDGIGRLESVPPGLQTVWGGPQWHEGSCKCRNPTGMSLPDSAWDSIPACRMLSAETCTDSSNPSMRTQT